MLSKIRQFSPIARAIGILGATAALVTAVTFAQLTSNTVALTNNSVTVATASLAVGVNCAPESRTSAIQGFNVSSLAPGSSATINFCLTNTGGVPLDITGDIPQDLSGSSVAQHIELEIVCDDIGNIDSALLSTWGPEVFDSPLGAGQAKNCTAEVTLSNAYAGNGGESVPIFHITFVGNQPAPNNG